MGRSSLISSSRRPDSAPCRRNAAVSLFKCQRLRRTTNSRIPPPASRTKAATHQNQAPTPPVEKNPCIPRQRPTGLTRRTSGSKRLIVEIIEKHPCMRLSPGELSNQIGQLPEHFIGDLDGPRIGLESILRLDKVDELGGHFHVGPFQHAASNRPGPAAQPGG